MRGSWLAIILSVPAALVRGRVYSATLIDVGPYTITIDTDFNPIIAPAAGDIVTVGDDFTIKWKQTNNQSLTFTLCSVNSETNFTKQGEYPGISELNDGSHVWTTGADILAPSGYSYVLFVSGTYGGLSGNISPVFALSNPAFGGTIPSGSASSTGSSSTAPSGGAASSPTSPSTSSPNSSSSGSSPPGSSTSGSTSLGSSSSASSGSTGSSPSAGVIGGAVGGTLSAIIIVLLVVVLILLRRRRVRNKSINLLEPVNAATTKPELDGHGASLPPTGGAGHVQMPHAQQVPHMGSLAGPFVQQHPAPELDSGIQRATPELYGQQRAEIGPGDQWKVGGGQWGPTVVQRELHELGGLQEPPEPQELYVPH